jgi:hypothetical protein
LLALLVSGPLGFATPAAAATSQVVLPGGIAAEVWLPKKNGFSFEIFTLGRKRVRLIAHRGSENVVYAAPGHVSSRRLHANFGRFGLVDLRFHPARREGSDSDHNACRGRDPIEQDGTYRGTIRFHDAGVATLASHRAIGFFQRKFKTICEVPRIPSAHHPRRSDFEADLLSARRQSGNRVVAFEAVSLDLGDQLGLELAIVGGELREDFDRVLVVRSALELANEGEIRFSKPGVRPETVAVSAPRPFAGQASYSESPTGPASWTGTLSVPLPGRGRIPLTGPGFQARVCRAHSFQGLFDCEPGAHASRRPLRRSPASGPLPLLQTLRAAAPTPSPWPRQGSPR